MERADWTLFFTEENEGKKGTYGPYDTVYNINQKVKYIPINEKISNLVCGFYYLPLNA